MGDNVNHPDHYQNIAGVESIDILNDVVKDLPGKQAAMLWNAMKYLFRFQKKNGVEDLKKARNYLDYLIADMDAVCDAAEKLWDTWYSNEYGHVWIFAGTNPKGMPTKLIFETKDAAEEFKSVFYNMQSEGYDEFSIVDACLEMKFKFTKGNKWNNWDELVPWKKVHNRFSIKEANGKYELIFVYKSSSSEEAKNMKTNNDPCVIYGSKTFGNAKVYYSTHMFAGTCKSIVFPSDLQRYMFIASFFAKLTAKDFKVYSIRDVLSDSNFVVPDGKDNFSTKLTWKDIFSKFEMRTEGEKYILDFIYWIKTGTKNKCISYHSSVWGNADVYYSTDMPAGTCTRILFDDKDGINTFMIKFFRYIDCAGNGFPIKDVLEDATYRFHTKDTDLCVYAPWNEIFDSFRMYEEAGKYVLEFVYKKDTEDAEDDSEPLLGEEWYAYF